MMEIIAPDSEKGATGSKVHHQTFTILTTANG